MQPLFRILAGSREITAAVRDRLLELVLTDEAGTQSDELKLTLDDRRRENGAIAELPQVGTVLTVSIGYAQTRLVAMGRFIVDEIELNAPAATLTVSAKAADMVGPFRSPKTRSWDETTLGDLVQAIAGEHGYQDKIDPELGALAIPHLDQTAESDMALLTRLAAKHDAVAKPVAGFLVLAKQGAAKTIAGQLLPTVWLHASDLTQWRYKHSARKPAGAGATTGDTAQAPPKPSGGGVRAYWWDMEAGEQRSVSVGSEPFEDIRYVHATEAEAKAAATTRKQSGERSQGELSFSLPGDTRLSAEGKLMLFVRPGVPAEWRIKRVVHRISTQGFTTQVDCERANAPAAPAASPASNPASNPAQGPAAAS